ncbi:MAG: hypothetical protein ABIO43_02935 [Sphingomicrobium sp.]
MRCAECAAEVPPLREFCPKCGAPTDPGLRERRHRLGQPRSTGELKGNRKKVLIAAAAVLGLGVVGNAIFDPDWDRNDRRTIPSRPEARGAVTISAEDLYQAYRDDEDAADRRFDGREMVVSGEFLRIVPDGYGSLDLRLKTSNPEVPVGIDLAGLAVEDGKKLRPGQQVTVSCQRMGGSGNELWVRDCAIQSVEGDSVAPASPSASPSAPALPAATEGNSG